jgi:hypothetical protein
MKNRTGIFLFILFFTVILFSIGIILDDLRWFEYGFLIQFILCLAIIFHLKSELETSITSLKRIAMIIEESPPKNIERLNADRLALARIQIVLARFYHDSPNQKKGNK